MNPFAALVRAERRNGKPVAEIPAAAKKTAKSAAKKGGR
jgi:hypothetical protein